jgi:transposase
MTERTTAGVGLAKSVFQLHRIDAKGAVVLRRRVRRSRMLECFQRLAACLIGMEACAGAHLWAHLWARASWAV